MKKRICLLIMLLLFPSQVFASSSIDSKCNDDVCDIVLNTKDNVSAIDIKFKDNNVISFEIDENWQGTYENNELLLYTDVNKTGVINIGKAKLNNNIKKTNIKYSSYFNDKFEEIVIIEEKDVNKKKNIDNTKKETFSYGKIILIIALCALVVGSYLYYKKRGVK